jgi:hypothetical protein
MCVCVFVYAIYIYINIERLRCGFLLELFDRGAQVPVLVPKLLNVALCCREHFLYQSQHTSAYVAYVRAVSAYSRTYVTHALKVAVARSCMPAVSSSLALNRSTADTCTLRYRVSSAERSSTRSSSSPRARLDSAAAPLGVSCSLLRIFTTDIYYGCRSKEIVHALLKLCACRVELCSRLMELFYSLRLYDRSLRI